jgi:hypothetical protein
MEFLDILNTEFLAWWAADDQFIDHSVKEMLNVMNISSYARLNGTPSNMQRCTVTSMLSPLCWSLSAVHFSSSMCPRCLALLVHDVHEHADEDDHVAVLTMCRLSAMRMIL